jgi:signal transduction histidine kinase
MIPPIPSLAGSVVPVLATLALLAFLGFVLYRLYRSLRRGLSIRMQVFVAMAAVSGVFAALLGVIAVQRLELRAARLFAEVAQEDAELLARLVATDSSLLTAPAGPDEVARALGGLRLDEIRPGALRIEVRDNRGRLVFAAGPPELQGIAASAPVRPPGTVAAVPPRGSVRVVRAGLGLRVILREVAARAAVLTLLLVMGTAAAAALVGRAIAKPIERLTLHASRIAHGERSAPLPRPYGREVRTLTAALESMRRELEGRPLAERLAADLSHELKNPVAAIRASAEVLADGALEDPEAARRFVGRILEATQRVLAIVNNLLMLTRLQARGVADEAVDVLALLRHSVDALQGRAEKRHVHIRIEAPDSRDPRELRELRELARDVPVLRERGEAPARLVVRGDAAWLRRALDNLIDNAISFSAPRPVSTLAPAPDATQPASHAPPLPSLPSPIDPEGARPEVVVRLFSDGKQAQIEVINEGPGIAPEVRGRLFERFVTTRRDDGGSGLGLAIVAAVAEQHGGSVEAIEPGPPITRFRLSLPLAS